MPPGKKKLHTSQKREREKRERERERERSVYKRDISRSIFTTRPTLTSDIAARPHRYIFHKNATLTQLKKCQSIDWGRSVAKLCLFWGPSVLLRFEFVGGRPSRAVTSRSKTVVEIVVESIKLTGFLFDLVFFLWGQAEKGRN